MQPFASSAIASSITRLIITVHLVHKIDLAHSELKLYYCTLYHHVRCELNHHHYHHHGYHYLFLPYTERWCLYVSQVQTCRYVLLAGLVMMTIPLVVMCFFNDTATLGHEEATDRTR